MASKRRPIRSTVRSEAVGPSKLDADRQTVRSETAGN